MAAIPTTVKVDFAGAFAAPQNPAAPLTKQKAQWYWGVLYKPQYVSDGGSLATVQVMEFIQNESVKGIFQTMKEAKDNKNEVQSEWVFIGDVAVDSHSIGANAAQNTRDYILGKLQGYSDESLAVVHETWDLQNHSYASTQIQNGVPVRGKVQVIAHSGFKLWKRFYPDRQLRIQITDHAVDDAKPCIVEEAADTGYYVKLV